MSVSVSCNHCSTRLKLSDELFNQRIRGRIVHLRCAACREKFRVDARRADLVLELPRENSQLETIPAPPDSSATRLSSSVSEYELPASLRWAGMSALSAPIGSQPLATPALGTHAALASNPNLVRDFDPAAWHEEDSSVRVFGSLQSSTPSTPLAAEGAANDATSLPEMSAPAPLEIENVSAPQPETAVSRPPMKSLPPPPPRPWELNERLGRTEPPHPSPHSERRAPAESGDRDSFLSDPPPISRPLSLVPPRPEDVARPKRRAAPWLLAAIVSVAAGAGVALSVDAPPDASMPPDPAVATAPKAAVSGAPAAVEVKPTPQPSLLAVESPTPPAPAPATSPSALAPQSSPADATEGDYHPVTYNEPVAPPEAQREREEIARPSPGVPHERAEVASETASAEMLSEGAKPAVLEEPSAPATEEPAPGPFDRSAAVAALRVATGHASACRKANDPTGTARVVVIFAPSGRVTSATVSGPPFAGTATGGCIASRFRGARIPAFEGDHVTVTKTVVIQ